MGESAKTLLTAVIFLACILVASAYALDWIR